MGEVWRARDSRLRRDVAIKSLSALLALDPGRLARLEREAELLASLNHHHIATIQLGGTTKLFDWRKPTEGRSGRFYDVAPDGRFLVATPTGRVRTGRARSR